MIPFAVRIIVVPALALAAAAIGAIVYFRSVEKPPTIAAVQSAPPAVTGAPSAPPAVTGPPSAPPAPVEPPQATAALPSSTAAPSGGSAAVPKAPEFDIVRVTPGGETVVAGRAPGAARVELLDQGRVIAAEKVDQNGQFVLLPPPLDRGDHLLALRITPEGQPPVSSNQSVAVAVRPGTGPIVTMAEPGKPSVVLGAPAAAGAGEKPAESSAPSKTQVTIQTAEVEAGGRFFATGTAPPGSTVRLYLNGSHVADAAAAPDRKWSLTISKGVSGGRYALRADSVGDQGKVIARAEVPFDAPAALASAAPVATPAPSAVAPTGSQPGPAISREPANHHGVASPAAAPSSVGGDPARSQAAVPQPESGTSVAGNEARANPVVPELSTATVTRGDSLWRISRLRWGKGTRYTVLYEANASQIRNPDLIYPGQVLVMPQN